MKQYANVPTSWLVPAWPGRQLWYRGFEADRLELRDLVAVIWNLPSRI